MPSNNKTQVIAEPGKQELFIIREFDAPRELVFKAFNEPELLTQWLGPKNSEMIIEKFDNRSGGSYRFIHKDCNGRGEFAFNGAIHEVFPPERVIRTFEFEGLPERGHVATDFLTMHELPGNRTKVHIQSVFKSVEDRDGMVNSGMEGGVNDGFSKLDDLLTKHL